MTARLSEMIAVQMEGESRGSGSPLLYNRKLFSENFRYDVATNSIG